VWPLGKRANNRPNLGDNRAIFCKTDRDAVASSCVCATPRLSRPPPERARRKLAARFPGSLGPPDPPAGRCTARRRRGSGQTGCHCVLLPGTGRLPTPGRSGAAWARAQLTTEFQSVARAAAIVIQIGLGHLLRRHKFVMFLRRNGEAALTLLEFKHCDHLILHKLGSQGAAYK